MAQWIKCGEKLVNVDAVAAVFRHSDQTHVFLSGIGDNAHMHFAAEDGRKLWEWFLEQKPIDVLLDPPPLADPLLPKKRASPLHCAFMFIKHFAKCIQLARTHRLHLGVGERNLQCLGCPRHLRTHFNFRRCSAA